MRPYPCAAITPEQLDTSTWPTVAHNELPKAERDAYLRRERAVNAYIASERIARILKTGHIARGELYRWLKRCVTVHADGRLQGCRGLLVGRHVIPRRRKTPVVISAAQTGSRGANGAFIELLETHPRLRMWIERQVAQRQVLIDTLDTTGRLRLRDLQRLHERFIERCREEGLTSKDYPLNTQTQAVRTLALAIKTSLMERFGAAARAAGAQHLKGSPTASAAYKARAAIRPYEVVEFDAHRVDVRLKCVSVDPQGFVHEYEIERVWLLVLLDQFTRCVLGYHIVLGPEYSRADVIRTVERALEPHRAVPITIPGVKPGPRSGFPSSVYPELAYACWDTLRFDNARANLAEDTLSVLTEFVGCFAEAGPIYHPDERPYIERFFGTIARALAHRLPGTTGSSPADVRRRLTERSGSARLLVSVAELEQLFEVAIADYNGRAHEGLNARSPLEAMHYAIRRKHELPRWVSEPRRRVLCLMQSAHQARVHADPSRGVRPHVSLWGVRYTNETLAASGTLTGERLRVYLTPEDLREVRAFRADGTELGVLRAQGMWGATAHDLRLRKEILKLRRRHALPSAEGVDPIQAYLEYKRLQAKKSRREASQLAAAERLVEAGVLPRVPPAPVTISTRSTPAIDTSTLEPVRAFAARLNPGTNSVSNTTGKNEGGGGSGASGAGSTPRKIRRLDIPSGFVV